MGKKLEKVGNERGSRKGSDDETAPEDGDAGSAAPMPEFRIGEKVLIAPGSPLANLIEAFRKSAGSAEDAATIPTICIGSVEKN